MTVATIPDGAVRVDGPLANKDSPDFLVISSISPLIQRPIEPVGPHFLAHARRKRHNRTFSEDEKHQAEAAAKAFEEKSNNSDEEDEPETQEMLQRDPKEWKEQDHYAVLGLSKYRFKATEDQIKRAHRRKALKHHPDKKAGGEGGEDDDSFFKCIQKAYETLSNPVLRRQFDSVDEGADVQPPSKKSKGDFFKLWSGVFESEARFSNRQPVPQLGDIKSSKIEVEAFYDFWFKFDSWRSFEYLDKDPSDEGDSRDNKRYQERKNKAERAKHKKEDTARLRKIVEDCLSLDPRIKLFKEEEKKEKERRKWEREAGARAAEEERKKKEEDEKKRQEEEAEREKTERDDKKKAKEAAKTRVKKEKRVIKNSVKDVDYFASKSDGPVPAGIIDKVLSDVDLLVQRFGEMEMTECAAKLEGKKDVQSVRKVWDEVVSGLLEKGSVKENELKYFGKEQQ